MGAPPAATLASTSRTVWARMGFRLWRTKIRSEPAVAASHITSWLEEAERFLAAAGLDPGPARDVRKGILTFRSPVGTAEDFVNRASKVGVVLSARRGLVRVSPHFYNGEAELAALASLVQP
jgi:selenocysteine lyase/cysteine desulfurase